MCGELSCEMKKARTRRADASVEPYLEIGLFDRDSLEACLTSQLVCLLPRPCNRFVGLADDAALRRVVVELVGACHRFGAGEASLKDLAEAGFGLGSDIGLYVAAVLERDAEGGGSGSDHVQFLLLVENTVAVCTKTVCVYSVWRWQARHVAGCP